MDPYTYSAYVHRNLPGIPCNHVESSQAFCSVISEMLILHTLTQLESVPDRAIVCYGWCLLGTDSMEYVCIHSVHCNQDKLLLHMALKLLRKRKRKSKRWHVYGVIIH